MPATVEAHKYHGCGNDFLIVWEGQVQAHERSAFSRSICRRHWGVGADGCVFLAALGSNRFEYRIYNQDGSEAGFSGNGGRCACAFLHHCKLTDQPEVILETRAGSKRFRLLEGKAPDWTYRCWLGEPDLRPDSIPFRLPSHESRRLERIQGYPLAVGDQTVPITALSMGNPQCQVLVENLPSEEEFLRLGEMLERHPAFPDRTNVGFVLVEGRQRLRLRIWERGVGPTQSSGTGSAASAVVAILAGKADSPLDVYTESGVQQVEWRPGSPLTLTGPCRYVARIEFYWSQAGKREGLPRTPKPGA